MSCIKSYFSASHLVKCRCRKWQVFSEDESAAGAGRESRSASSHARWLRHLPAMKTPQFHGAPHGRRPVALRQSHAHAPACPSSRRSAFVAVEVRASRCCGFRERACVERDGRRLELCRPTRHSRSCCSNCFDYPGGMPRQRCNGLACGQPAPCLHTAPRTVLARTLLSPFACRLKVRLQPAPYPPHAGARVAKQRRLPPRRCAR